VDRGTAAVIVPWHDPLRVAEQAAVLDMLSQGRLRLGLGRGLARRECVAFRSSSTSGGVRCSRARTSVSVWRLEKVSLGTRIASPKEFRSIYHTL